MDSFEDKLYEAMNKANFHIRGTINFSSDKFQRFSSLNDHKRSKDLFVKIHDRGATFGDWRYQEEWVTWWYKDLRSIGISERKEREASKLLIAQQQARLRSDAIYRLRIIWHTYCHEIDIDDPEIPIHPYLKAKRIRPLYARYCRSRVVVPIRDIDNGLVSLQWIRADGQKRFKRNATPKNSMVWLSEPLPDMYDGVIRLCEGWATGCTIYEAIGAPVVCSLGANNLLSVAQQLKKKYPDALLKICADNDQWGEYNTGFIHAKDVALLTGSTIYWPDFTGFDCSQKPTDFNDLMCLAGIEEVENQLLFLKK